MVQLNDKCTMHVIKIQTNILTFNGNEEHKITVGEGKILL